MTTSKKNLILTLVILTTVGAGICLHAGDFKEPTILQRIDVQFKWIHGGQFAGYYMAQEEQFYKEAGLDVVFHENYPNLQIDPITSVVERKAQFSVAEGSAVISPIAIGKPIIAIGTDYQSSPVVVFSLQDQGIKIPRDLVGRSLKVSPTTHTAYLSMLYKQGVDPSSITEFSKTSGATRGANYLEDIKDETFDASEGYIMNQPLWLKEQGYDVQIMSVSDYGVDSYSDVLITHQDFLENNPDLVAAFVQATKDGWLYAINNPDKSAKVTIDTYRTSANSGTTLAHEAALLKASKRLVAPNGTQGVLEMSESVWVSMIEDMKNLGLLESDVKVNAVYKKI
jgi:ABC-type nitrate/sulfonate/bicarbonate transport system substrate-binding protein